MSTNHFEGLWRDVRLSNLVEEMKALVELGVDVSRVWAECERLLGNGPWDYDKLADTLVPSPVYNRLQEVLKEEAGHVHWLQVAAEQAYRKDMAWGGSEGLKRLAGNIFLGLITYIIVGFLLANDGTATYNSNKLWEILYAGRRRTIIRMVYIPGPHGEMRRAEEEPRSVLDRVGHVLRSLAIMWKHKRHGVQVLSCNIHPQTRLDQEAPGTLCYVKDGIFYINESGSNDAQAYGRVIYLEHSKLAGGAYLGQEESRPHHFEGGRAAILMDRDYNTRCTRTGQNFPILEAGQVYRYEEPLEEAILEITHEPNKWGKLASIPLFPLTILMAGVRGFFTWLFVGKPNLIRLMYKNQIQDEEVIKAAERKREAAEAYAREQEEALRTVLNAPNDVLLRSVRLAIQNPEQPGAFKDQDTEMAVIFVDMAGFTTWSSGIAAGAKMRFVRAFHDLCQAICFRHGALIFKAAGDGFMAVFPRGYEGDLRIIEIRDLVNSALNAAREIMDKVQSTLVIPDVGKPPNLRIGINAGIGQMGVIARMLDAIGDVVNFASRAESAADTNEIVLTTEALFQLASQEERFTIQITTPQLGSTVTVHGFGFLCNGTRMAKTNHVETWALMETATARIQRLLSQTTANGSQEETLAADIAHPDLERIEFEDLRLSPGGSRVIIRERP